MLVTCTCKHQSHVHKGYQPDPGEYEPWVCPGCGKRWRMFGGRHGVSLHEVRKAKNDEQRNLQDVLPTDGKPRGLG